MARQYGAPRGKESVDESYSSRRKDAEPKAKEADPSPPADVVDRFHNNADTDKRKEAVHHTIGTGPNNAASGDHVHDGSSGVALMEGITITGSKGGNTALASVINALVTTFGAKDSTT